VRPTPAGSRWDLQGFGAVRLLYWSIPAAWLAVLKGGSIASWQVYADTGPVHKIMDR
jgi:hypothetical protein